MARGGLFETRSTPAAVALTFLVVLGAGLFVIAVAGAAYALAGDAASTVATVAAVIAVLAFLTDRAYAPDERIPWVMLAALTILLSPAVPVAYLAWRWERRRPISVRKPDIRRREPIPH